jgi:modification methylase
MRIEEAVRGDAVILGDCCTIMDKMPPNSYDLIVTSPPYNLGNTSGGGLKGSKKSGLWKNAKLADGYDGHEDNMPHFEYVMWQRTCITQMLRILTDDGAIFYNHKWRVQNGHWQDRHDIMEGFPVRQIIIWKRRGGMNFNKGYFLPTYEVIYLITKAKFKLAPKANRFGDVWDIAPERGNPHPAPFPIELATRCIESTMARKVLDPFCGSGTTLVAAKRLGRGFTGIDKSEIYVRMASERLAKEDQSVG